MRIVIAGGSGFLGRPLASHLASKGHHVIVLARHPIDHQSTTNLKFDTWMPDGRAEGEWVRYLQEANAVINLAGAGIAGRRWTRSRKALLRGSRVLSTRSLVTAIRSLNRRPGVFLQGSAVGFYGSNDRTEDMFDESFPPGTDFLGTTCVDWETEARCVEPLGCRLVIVRTGIALAHDGGMIKKLIPPFQFFVGGPIGSGRQYISWVHRDDWISLVTWALETPTISGVFNASAPHPATNAELAKAIGHALRRPSWLRIPKVAVRAVVGELAKEGLIRGQRVVPKRALDYGFMFKYETIDDAVRAVAEQL